MKAVVLIFTVLFVLSSCDKGDSDPKPSKLSVEEQKQAIQNSPSLMDYTQTILPSSYTILDPNMADVSEKYTVGCQTQGQPSYNGTQLDPQLAVGQKTTEELADAEQLSGTSDNISTDTLLSLAPTQTIIGKDFSLLTASDMPAGLQSIDQIFAGSPNITITTTYNFSDPSKEMPQTNFSANYMPAAQDYVRQAQQQNQNQYNWSCTVNSGSWNSTTQKLSYQFSGRNIVAYATTDVSTGDVVCSDYDDQGKQKDSITLGHGQSVGVNITSNEVIGQSIANCGGTTIFSSTVIKLDNGRVVSSDVDKVSQAPLR